MRWTTHGLKMASTHSPCPLLAYRRFLDDSELSLACYFCFKKWPCVADEPLIRRLSPIAVPTNTRICRNRGQQGRRRSGTGLETSRNGLIWAPSDTILWMCEAFLTEASRVVDVCIMNYGLLILHLRWLQRNRYSKLNFYLGQSALVAPLTNIYSSTQHLQPMLQKSRAERS